MPICKTPVQKNNPNLKCKTKKQLIKTNQTVQKQFIYVEVAKKLYLKTLKCITILVLAEINVHCGTTFHVQESLL